MTEFLSAWYGLMHVLGIVAFISGIAMIGIYLITGNKDA